MNASIRKPLDFGPRGMAAALNMTEVEVIQARRRGEISLPDCVRSKEPRWSVLALGEEVKKRWPAGMKGLEPLIFSLQALARAEQAEGWRDEA